MRTTDIAIIGAGPYGLSISAHLAREGIYHEIFGRPMSSWRDFMPVGMVLRSEAHASNLWDPDRRYTLQRFCTEKALSYVPSGSPLPLAQFLDYAEWFQQRAVPSVRDRELTKLTHIGDGFRLEFAGSDTCCAKNVIIATGHRSFRNMPAALADLPRELCSHSSDHKDLGLLKGKEVIVVGGGQSSLETAALLHEHGADVRIVARDDRINWNPENRGERTLLQKLAAPEAGLGFGWRSVAASEFPRVFSSLPDALRVYLVRRTWGPSGAWWLQDRVAGKIPLLTSHDIVDAKITSGRIRLVLRKENERREICADHVIAATGFVGGLARLPYLDPVLRARIKTFSGAPRLSRCSESSVRGLFFVGMLAAPTFGPVMRFMFGAKHAAPALATRFARYSLPRMERDLVVAAKD